MKQNLILILLFIVSCTSNSKQDGIIIHDLDKDFPTTENISFSPIQSFEIMSQILNFAVKDSSMFMLERNTNDFGHCYNINSGKVISTLIGKGRAQNEMANVIGIELHGDSIMFKPSFFLERIKIFATKDILTKPMGDRKCSTVEIPDSLTSFNFIRIEKDKLFGLYENRFDDRNEIFFTLDDKGASLFGEIKKELFEDELSNSDMRSHTNNELFINYKNKIVASRGNGLLLEVIDVNNNTTDFSRYYNKIKVKTKGAYTSISATGALSAFSLIDISCDAKNIYCLSHEGINDEDEFGLFVYVFDWELNPVKKYELQSSHSDTYCQYYLSEDGKSIYYLTIEDEKQELFMAEIK